MGLFSASPPFRLYLNKYEGSYIKHSCFNTEAEESLWGLAAGDPEVSLKLPPPPVLVCTRLCH